MSLVAIVICAHGKGGDKDTASNFDRRGQFLTRIRF